MSLNNLELIEEYKHRSQNQESRKIVESPLLQKDVWHTINDLGLRVNEHCRKLTVNFSEFPQGDFKLLVKLFVLRMA
jgi:integrase/recombinase XerD